MDKNNLTLLQLLKMSVRIYFENLFLWFLVCVFVYLPMWACVIFALNRFDLSSGDLLQIFDRINFYDVVIFSLPFILFSCLAMAVISSVVQQNFFSKKTDLKVVLDNSLMKWGKLITTSFVYFSVLGISYFIPPIFIFFAVAFYFYAVVVALSEYDCFKAMRISRLSLQGRWFTAAIMILLCSMAKFFVRLLLSELAGHCFSNAFAYFAFYILLSELMGIFLNIFLVAWFLSVAMVKIEESKNKISA